MFMSKCAKCKTRSFFTKELWWGVEEDTPEGRLGSFIVMQKNATIKNIILEDVSSLITHRASSKLSSGWISSFNEILEFGGKVLLFCIWETHFPTTR